MSDESNTTTVATTQATAIAQKPQGLKGWLMSPQFQEQIAVACGDAIDPKHFLRVALTSVNKNPKLADCTKESVLQCCLDAASFGVETNGRDAHLIPYGKQCTLIIDYKGYVRLVMNTGTVSNIHADVVCEGDEFEYNLGEVKTHRIDMRKPRGAMYAAYCVATMKDGTKKAEVMSKDEIDAIRRRSRSGGSGPWVTDYNEMAKKGLALDTVIPTPAGWTTMGAIQVGDKVFDMEGTQTEVIAVSEVKSLPCFRVTFTNGDKIVCDDEHRWVATIGTNGSARRKRNGKWPVHTVNELFAAKQAGEMISMPVAGPLDCHHNPSLPMDPWVLGYWLGNGAAGDGKVTCHSADASDVIERICGSGFKIGAIRQDKRSLGCSIGIKKLKVALRASGVLMNKHIPSDYMRASKAQREMLLRGLMDSDGCIEKGRGRGIFASTNAGLAEQVRELICSLGESVVAFDRMQTGYGKTVRCYYVSWTPSFCPCTTHRKSRNFHGRKNAKYRGVASVEKVESVPTRCIAVASESKTYLAGRSMIPTHNTVFRRLQKWLPLSPEIQEKLDKDMRAEFAEIAEQMRSQPRKGFIAELAGDAITGDPAPEGETLELPATEGGAS